ncbi:MAG TPA: hypothetical protein ENK57_15605 [Polyangiaceae bacterium]|nr:hypothetical protein [Polyangiaceae bacterium]
MSKTARKKNRKQAASPSQQRTLHLAAIVRRSLYEFVIREGMKALDEMLEQDREQLCGPAHSRVPPTTRCAGGRRRVGSSWAGNA